MAAQTKPTLFVQFAPGYTWLDTAPVWTTIPASKILRVEISRGTTDDLRFFEPGSARIEVDNRPDATYTNGFIDPTSDASIRPRVPVRIYATWVDAVLGTVTYPLFRGLVQSFPFRYEANGDFPIATLECIDPSALIGSATLPETVAQFNVEEYGGIVEAYYPMGDTGTTMNDATGNQRNYDSLYTQVSVASISSGLLGAATYFDGNQRQYNRAINDISLGATEVRCISMWIKPTIFTGSRLLFSAGWEEVPTGVVAFTQQYAIAIWFTSTQVIAREYYRDNGGTTQTRTNTRTISLNDGQAHHIMAGFGFTDKGCQLYVDGVVGTETISASGTKYAVNTLSTFGGDAYAYGYFTSLGLTGYIGNMQEVTIFRIDPGAKVGGEYATLNDLADAMYAYGTQTFTESSSTRIGRYLDLINYPKPLRDLSLTPYTTVTNLQLGQNALSEIRSVETGEHGWFFIASDGTAVFADRYAGSTRTRSKTIQASFSKEGASVDLQLAIGYTDLGYLYDAENMINKVTITTAEANTQDPTVYDATSVSNYGERSESYSTKLNTTIQAQALAEMIVFEYGEPAKRPDQFVVRPGRFPDYEYPTLLGLELLDLIALDPPELNLYTPTGSFLRYIGISITPGQIWEWTLGLAGRPTQNNYFILDVSELDDGKVLGF